MENDIVENVIYFLGVIEKLNNIGYYFMIIIFILK